MKRIVNILILFSGILFIYIVVSGLIPFECLFKKLFDIRCIVVLFTKKKYWTFNSITTS